MREVPAQPLLYCRRASTRAAATAPTRGVDGSSGCSWTTARVPPHAQENATMAGTTATRVVHIVHPWRELRPERCPALHTCRLRLAPLQVSAREGRSHDSRCFSPLNDRGN